MTQAFLIYLAIVNVLVLGLSILDKALVVHRKRRIPAREILYLSWMGGALGAKLAHVFCGTKTRRSDYFVTLNLIIVFQCGLTASIWAVQSTQELDVRSAALTSWSAKSEADEAPVPKRFGPGS